MVNRFLIILGMVLVACLGGCLGADGDGRNGYSSYSHDLWRYDRYPYPAYSPFAPYPGGYAFPRYHYFPFIIDKHHDGRHDHWNNRYQHHFDSHNANRNGRQDDDRDRPWFDRGWPRDNPGKRNQEANHHEPRSHNARPEKNREPMPPRPGLKCGGPRC